MSIRIAVPLLLLACLATPAAAQRTGPYLRLSVGAARVDAPAEQFRLDRVVQPSFAVGYAPSGRHAIELRAGYVEAEVTETLPEGAVVEAPTTIGVRAVPLALAYQLRLPFPGSRLTPLASAAATWTRVTDTWRSDTPEEDHSTFLFGFDAGAGVEARLTGRTSVVARGGYRFTKDADDRYFRGIGLSGAYADVGVQIGW